MWLGLVSVCGKSNEMARVLPVVSCCHWVLRAYPSFEIASSTFSRVREDASGLLLSTLETVATETPASRATSRMVWFFIDLRPLPPIGLVPTRRFATLTGGFGISSGTSYNYGSGWYACQVDLPRGGVFGWRGRTRRCPAFRGLL